MTQEEKNKLLNATRYLYDDAIEALEKGFISSRPVDDTAIIVYGITKDELEPYMRSEFLGTHWSDILDMILAKRREKKTT